MPVEAKYKTTATATGGALTRTVTVSVPALQGGAVSSSTVRVTV